MMKLGKRQQWLLFATAASTVAAPLAERAAVAAWRFASGDEPPNDTADDDIGLWRALAWAAAAGAVMAIAQVVARRGAALAWEHMTGEEPPRRRKRRRSRLARR